MVNRSQIVPKARLQWSLLLTVLLGLCSFSAPHLLGHAHAHHNAAGRVSRTGGSSHRSRLRSGSNSADGDHDSDAIATLKAFDPHTPDHAAPAVALIPDASIAPVQWDVLEAVIPHDDSAASSLPEPVSRGRAPPVA